MHPEGLVKVQLMEECVGKDEVEFFADGKKT